MKEDQETPRSGASRMGEASDTVKVTRNSRSEDNYRPSDQGKTLKSAGWDFSIGGPEGTGTFRSVARPPQSRDKKTEVSYNQLTQRRDLRVPHHDEHLDDLEDDELSGNGSGTVVIRSPKGSRSSAFRDLSPQSSSNYASFEDASSSGTVVLRGQHDEPDSPRTPRSRLGIHDRNSNSSMEDSVANLAEAKAAIQRGQRKVNPRERFAREKNDRQESNRDQKTSSSDSSRSHGEYNAHKGMLRSHHASDDEESAKIMPSSVPLSVLLIPSLRECRCLLRSSQ